MATRVVEGKRLWEGGTAITVDNENRVISLNLRDENNLIIYDAGDDEIYVDLQLPDEVMPTDAFPVGITTGRAVVDNGWDLAGTIIIAKTTSGDMIKVLYADNGTLWLDNGTGTFKQIYFKADVDAIAQALQNQIDYLMGLGKFLSLWDCVNGEPMSFPHEIPYEYHTGDYYLVGAISSATPPVNYKPDGSEWDDTPSQVTESVEVQIGDVYIYDGSVWLHQLNHERVVTFANIAGQPTDNQNLATALGNKQDTLVSGTNIKSINNNSLLGSGDLSIAEVPSGGTNGQVLTQTSQGPAWQNATGGADIEYKTQAEYNALLPGALTDNKHYFIYSFPIIHVTGVTLDESSISLTTVGDTYQLTATVSPNDAYDKSVTWSSSDTTIATVSQSGLVTCVTPGTCTITVTTTDGGFTATCGVDGGGWQPGANTIAYYPLDSTNTVNDLSGHNYTLTNNGGVAFGVNQGVNCVSFSGSNWLSRNESLITGGTSFTINYFLYNNTLGGSGTLFSIGQANSNYSCLMFINSNTSKLYIGGWDNDRDTGQVMSTGTWYNIAFTHDNGTAIVYLNGQQIYSGSVNYGIKTGWTALGTGIGGGGNGNQSYMSKFILEDKVRTAQEIADYFNQTKGDYGIS